VALRGETEYISLKDFPAVERARKLSWKKNVDDTGRIEVDGVEVDLDKLGCIVPAGKICKVRELRVWFSDA